MITPETPLISAAKNCKRLMKAMGKKKIQSSNKSYKVTEMYQLNSIQLTTS